MATDSSVVYADGCLQYAEVYFEGDNRDDIMEMLIYWIWTLDIPEVDRFDLEAFAWNEYSSGNLVFSDDGRELCFTLEAQNESAN
jgi:hypothetical protein